MKYILDSNIFIEAKNHAYGMSFHPGFWKFLEIGIVNGNILLLDAVWDELTHFSEDELAVWAQSLKIFVTPAKTKPEILARFQEASEFVINNKRWTKRVNEFLSGADLWVIATAMADKKHIAIVTNEQPDINNNCQTPKIPAVARCLGCESMGLWSFLREVLPTFVLEPSSVVFGQTVR